MRIKLTSAGWNNVNLNWHFAGRFRFQINKNELNFNSTNKNYRNYGIYLLKNDLKITWKLPFAAEMKLYVVIALSLRED